MFKRAIWALVFVMCLAIPARVRAQGDYLEVLTVKVKPDKAAEYEALTKKWVDANRRFGGDHWLAMETVYGEGSVYTFVSPRKDYADVDKMNEVEMQAVTKAYGKEATEKMVHDFESCTAWSRNELRRRRMDLSRKAPTDMASYAKLIGESRVLRSTAVHLRPGKSAEFEAFLKELKEVGEKNPDTQPLLVSQVIEGSKGMVFYLTTLRQSLGGFDHNLTAHDILGDEGYKKYLQTNSELVEESDSSLYRFSAELSNPLDEIAKVAADFWTPKSSTVAAAPRQKAAAAAKASAKVETPDKP